VNGFYKSRITQHTRHNVQGLPSSYEQAIADAQQATRDAIEAGVRLIEIEFPTAGLLSVAGDAEGQNEMTYSLEFLRKFLIMFQLKDQASSTRIFFPDKQVLYSVCLTLDLLPLQCTARNHQFLRGKITLRKSINVRMHFNHTIDLCTKVCICSDLARPSIFSINTPSSEMITHNGQLRAI
jgi:hypothetical protein